MRSSAAARVALVLLAVSALAVGIPAAFAPHTFYSDFPFFVHWVDLLPPYNQHLVTDVGGLYLGFAVLFGWSARTLQPGLVRAASVAWLVPAVLHLIFHASHLDGFSTGNAIAELGSLAYLIVLPLIALWASRPDALSG